MPKLDAVIITPWIGADPHNPDPALQANRPQLTTDYQHIQSAPPQLIDEFSGDVQHAVAQAEAHGQTFRSQLHSMAPTGATGYGLRVPLAIWHQLQAQAEEDRVAVVSRYPFIMGPVTDPAETDWELYRMVLNVTQEGVRLFEDVTGQPSENIVPLPNQYSVRAIVDETVLSAIDANPVYWYMSGVTIPDDPLDPGATPPSPIEKPPSVEMTPAEQDAYRAWQEAQGMPTSFLAGLRDLSKIIYASEPANPTFGAAAVVTASWQRTLDQSGVDPYVLPSLSIIATLLMQGMRGKIPEADLSAEMQRLIDDLKEQRRREQLLRR